MKTAVPFFFDQNHFYFFLLFVAVGFLELIFPSGPQYCNLTAFSDWSSFSCVEINLRMIIIQPLLFSLRFTSYLVEAVGVTLSGDMSGIVLLPFVFVFWLLTVWFLSLVASVAASRLLMLSGN